MKKEFVLFILLLVAIAVIGIVGCNKNDDISGEAYIPVGGRCNTTSTGALTANPCVAGYQCDSGICKGSINTLCSATKPCAAGSYCDPSTGRCKATLR